MVEVMTILLSDLLSLLQIGTSAFGPAYMTPSLIQVSQGFRKYYTDYVYILLIFSVYKSVAQLYYNYS